MEPTIRPSGSCTTRLLSDEPADRDDFGSHERLAEAVVRTLLSEDGGRTIALTGAWGSGKSTVIELIRGKFESASDAELENRVHVFDAWAHQGDPLRRSFLEAFLEHLTSRNWISDDTATRQRAGLGGTREESASESTPALRPRGRAFLATLALVPIGIALYAESRNLLLQILGVVLALSPHLFALGLWFSWRPGWKFWKPEFWRKHRPPHSDESVLDLFSRQTKTLTTSTIRRTRDPTSIEFRDAFFELLGNALADRQRRLLIVLDNLDRIPSSDALKIWATMRTFFDPTRGAGIDLTRLWLLVPFDPHGIKRVWRTPEAIASPSSDDLAEAFMDKSFQLIFRVPTPVLSRWKLFFERRSKDVLPEHQATDDEGALVYRQFRISRIAQGKSVTPRDIKVFLNSLGAVHRQWGDEIPLPSQALYVIHAGLIEEEPTRLLGEDVIVAGIRPLLPEMAGWQRHLAAIHFNVPPEDAIEVLIGPQVERALEEGDGAQLEEFAQIPGFAAICEQVIDEQYEEWQRTEPSAIALASGALGTLSSYSPPPSVWRQLGRAAQVAEEWPWVNPRVGEGLGILIRHSPDGGREAIAEQVLTALSATEVQQSSEDSERPSMKDWIAGSLPLVRAIKSLGLPSLIANNLKIPGDADGWVEGIVELTTITSDEDEIHDYARGEDGERIVNSLSQLVARGDLTSDHTRALDVALATFSDVDWEALWNSLHPRLSVGQLSSTDELDDVVEWILHLLAANKVEPTDQALASAATGGHLLHQLHVAVAEGQVPTIAKTVMLILLSNPTGNATQDAGNSANGRQQYQNMCADPSGYKEVLSSLASIATRFGLVNNLLKVPGQAPNTTLLVARVLDDIAQTGAFADHVHSDAFLESFQFLEQELTEDGLGAALKSMARDGSLRSRLREEFQVERASLYRRLLEALPPSKRQGFQRFIKEGLSLLPVDVWKQEFDVAGPLVQLVAAVQKDSDFHLELGPSLAEAVSAHASEILDGSLSSGGDEVAFGMVVASLSPDLRITTLDNLRDELLRHPDRDLSSFLSLYGETLIQSGTLEEKADDVTRALLSRIVERRSTSELAWVTSLIEARPQLLSKSKDGSRRLLLERIEQALDEAPDDTIKQHLETLRSALRAD